MDAASTIAIAIFFPISIGFLIRVGWTIAGDMLYKVGFRDVTSCTTVNTGGGSVIVQSPPAKGGAA